MKVQIGGGAVLAAAAVAAVGLGLWYASRKVPQALAAAGEWTSQNLVPWKDTNAAYSAVNAAGGAIVTDPAGPGKNADGSWSLGGWWRDVTSNDDERIAAMLSTTPTNAARADVARVEAASGGATGSW